jgi:ribose/xylose/arabinose/galactoside ABC-type transport system permease subunit
MRRLNVAPAVLVAALLILVFSVSVPRFASLGNAENLLRIAAILAIAASGQAIVLMTGGLDFSTGASVALVSVATALLLHVFPAALAVPLGALVAVVVGLLNGVLIGRLGLTPLIATLGMSLVCGGLAAHLAGGMPLDPAPSDAFAWLGRGTLAGLPVPIWLAAGCCVLLHGLLTRSVVGRYWTLLGTNARATRLAGVPVQASLVAAYGCAGLLTGLAGAILTSRVASGQPQLWPALPFESIAACAVGGISLAGGRGSVLQVVTGVLIVAMLNNVVVLLNLPAAVQQIVMAGVIVGAVALQLPALRERLWRLPRRQRQATEVVLP